MKKFKYKIEKWIIKHDRLVGTIILVIAVLALLLGLAGIVYAGTKC